MPDEKPIVTNRKWKLTLGMIALYTVIFGGLYLSVGGLLWRGVIEPEIWRGVISSQTAMWAYGVFGIAGWYLGMNVIQKWSPFPGSGVGK